MELFGPFLPLLWSPELLTRTSALGEYLRHQSSFPPHLSELLILVAARLSSQPYEWSLHYPIALDAGVDRTVADAIGEGRRPECMSEDEEILYDLSTELVGDGNVSGPTYARALARFGERGVIEAAGILGYYTMLAMILHVARTPPEPDGPPLPALGGRR
jgi:4-carboxymuconolactone decarboxylase